MLHREVTLLIAITALCAVLVASSGVGPAAGDGLWAAYAYWLVRLFIEAALFVAFREIIEKLTPVGASAYFTTGCAILLSLIPFVLAITAFDIVLGYPELNLQSGEDQTNSQLSAFGLELVFLFDNHLALCLLLSLPRYLSGNSKGVPDPKPPAETASPALPAGSYLADLAPPIQGEIIWAEAQEHYVRLVTTKETRLVLNRFSDILRELPEGVGMQVHRSHWVAYSAIAESFKNGANLRLRLNSGDDVPVSRSFRQALEKAISV